VSDVPPGLAAGGRHLWKALLHQDATLTDEMNPVRPVALEACRTKDRCDQLDVVCRSEPVMLDNGKGQPVAHPAWVEARQQANILKQLIASLRLPDEATGKRPQVRAARGAYQPRATGSAAVSSLDRARAAKSS
jgi:hypothetical protein